MGIGRPVGGGDLVTYVLNDFTKEEEKEVEVMIEKSVELVISDLLSDNAVEKT